MTTPQQPQPQQPSQAQQQALALAAATALAGAATVPAALTVIMPVAAAMSIRRRVVEAALGIVMGHPPDAAGFYGPATHNVARANLVRRAAFLAASIFRLNGDDSLMQAGMEAGWWEEAVQRERGYYGQQLVAGWNREQAGAAVDSASMEHGRLLGWYTKIDKRTSMECLAANRCNFYADQMPAIGYPGMVHPHCRCQPGAPFPGAPMVPAATVRGRGGKVPDHRHERRRAAAGQQ
jgi:hypothetical protein